VHHAATVKILSPSRKQAETPVKRPFMYIRLRIARRRNEKPEKNPPLTGSGTQKNKAASKKKKATPPQSRSTGVKWSKKCPEKKKKRNKAEQKKTSGKGASQIYGRFKKEGMPYGGYVGKGKKKKDQTQRGAL